MTREVTSSMIVCRDTNGEIHRQDGPAVIYMSGIQSWYKNGKRHREDGPAIIWSDGHAEHQYSYGIRQERPYKWDNQNSK